MCVFSLSRMTLDLSGQITGALVKSGYLVEFAVDGDQGHYLGDTSDFDAVVLDLGLPGMNGIEVLRKWRDAGRSMPVLILTARDLWSEKASGFEAGADASESASLIAPLPKFGSVSSSLTRTAPSYAPTSEFLRPTGPSGVWDTTASFAGVEPAPSHSGCPATSLRSIAI